MEKEQKKQLIIRELFCVLIFTPVIIYIITQFSFRFFHMASFVVLILVVGIFAMNILPRSAFIKNVNKKIKFEGGGVMPVNGGIGYQHVTDELEVNMSEQTQHPMTTRVIHLVATVVMVIISVIVYNTFVNKPIKQNATLVDAKVVKTLDLSTKTIKHEGNTTTEAETSLCEVTFVYTLNGEEHEVKHRFNGISSFQADMAKIYVKNNKFVSTLNGQIWGRVFTWYYIILAVIHFIRSFFATDVAAALVGTLFSSIAVIFMMGLVVSFKQIFFMGFGAVILVLTTCGIGILLFSNEPSIDLYSHTSTKFSASVRTGKR